MSTIDSLEIASRLMKKGDFNSAIKLLESNRHIYEGAFSKSFEYYFLLGQASLYVGDLGTASYYFEKARGIKINDVNLLLGQAIIFLIRGDKEDNERAIQCYLDVQSLEPENKIAKEALLFIKESDFTTVRKWFDTGKIKRFYPPLSSFSFPSFSFAKLFYIFLPIVAATLGFLLVYAILTHKALPKSTRALPSGISLSKDEQTNPTDENALSSVYKLSDKEVLKCYKNAQLYFFSYQDNACQKEINKILCSNAIPSIKQKSQIFMEYLVEPTFDTITNNPKYDEAKKDPLLYLDCYAVWKGRIANSQMQNEKYVCDFLLGYETMENVEDIITLYFDRNPGIKKEEPVTVLGKISIENGKICLNGKAIHQGKESLLKNQ